MSTPPLRIIVLDTETTGFVPKVHRIIELAWLLIENGNVTKEFESLLSVPDDIPPTVEVLTRIDTEHLQGKPTFKDVVGQLSAVLTPETIIVGQNIAFDLSMLKGEGLDLSDYPRLDTAMLASLVFPEARSFSLSFLSSLLDLPHEPVHRAMGDVRATAALLQRCLDRMEELPEDLLHSARSLLGRSPGGLQMLANVLPKTGAGAGEPAWLVMERGQPVERGRDSVDLTLPKIGSVQIREQAVSTDGLGQLLSTPLQKGEERRIVAVKNLESTLRQTLLPKQARAIVPPQFLLDPEARDRLLNAQTLTPDEATLALKLAWYDPARRSELPLHGDERAVWNGLIACTPTSPVYLEQFKDLPEIIVIDHQQLLQFVSGESPEAKRLLEKGAHIVVTDASMLEDTATKAFGAYLSIDDLRASAQGDTALTSLADLLSIFVEKLGGEDVRYLVPDELQSREAKGLRDLIAQIRASGVLPVRTEHLLTQVEKVLAPDGLEGRIAWVERRRGGGISLQSAPEHPAELLRTSLYDRAATTLLLPPGKAGDEAPIVPVTTTKVERTPASADPEPVTFLFENALLDAILREPPAGKTIVLLGSKRSIEIAFVKYTELLEEKGVKLICQGMSGGQGRMEADFIAATGQTVWLLTPWTYEGTELPAGTVDRLFIETLPFDHPSHPVLSRRAARFRDAFSDYLLPRLEQRMFRLLRTFAQQRRAGAEVAILDRRLFEKDYGRRIQAYLKTVAHLKDSEQRPVLAPVPAAIRPKPVQKKATVKKPAKKKENDTQLPLL